MKKELLPITLLISILIACFSCQSAIQLDKPYQARQDIKSLLNEKGLSQGQVFDISQSTIAARCAPVFELIALRGNINHFGYNMDYNPPKPLPYKQTVSGVKVWIAEYPWTRYYNIKSDENGIWTMYILKLKGTTPGLSFMYEKEGWITTKSNVITITDEDNLDMSIQFIDPVYYKQAIKPGLEMQLSQKYGIPVTLKNALAVTVGKSWASMHDDRLPHGDPGAIVKLDRPLSFPEIIGPLYFNKKAQPDLAQTETSVDGGVAWINAPVGELRITAEKASFSYKTVQFNISGQDRELGVELYIATPPDSVLGTNNSGPGLP